MPRILCADESCRRCTCTVFNVTELANTVVTYEVSSSFTGVVGFSVSPEGPFMPTVEIAIPLDANGSGTSATFALKALDIGHTLVNACSDAPALGCILNPRDVAVMGISSIEYNVINSPLDPTPARAAGCVFTPNGSRKPTPSIGARSA